MNSDRNLLFGILALHNDMITQDELITAMNAWVNNKDRTLDDILVEQEALSPARQAVISAFVQEHLSSHGNDPEESLVSLGTTEPVRNALNQIDDTDIELSLSHTSTVTSFDPGQTSPFESGRSDQHLRLSESINRFEIIRPHARGGLGEVSVAQDLELNREVALKEIQERYASDPNSRSRFVLEAEITGGLEHPGIVPVYGLGQYEDGRPYYAMRFIRGDSLKEATDQFHKNKPVDDSERSFQLRKLLGRFIDVCNSIEYAHARGVLHRDLKPGNIMLGKYGETLVVDWGLAKTVDQADETIAADEPPIQPSAGSGATPTQMGSVIGTPAYMSPEQAGGRLDELGTASDVYSLGATLYYLLTGHPPVSGDTIAEVLEKVQSGAIQRPNSADITVPKSLDAICMRAMATDANDRYESPGSLADDVERFLADEPVRVCIEPLSVRTRRWIRKHPKTVASMAATFLVGFVSTVLVAGVVSTKNTELAEKNSELDTINGKLAKANEELTHSNEQERLAKEQAQHEQRVAQSVRDFLQRDLLLQADVREQADRLWALGETQFQTEQNPTIRELLDRAAAELKPATIDEKFPDQKLVQAEILETVGETYARIGRAEEAISHLQRARNLYQTELGANRHETLVCTGRLAGAYRSVGDIKHSLQLHVEAANGLKSALGASHRDSKQSLSLLAFAFADAGEFINAIVILEESVEQNRIDFGTDHPNTTTSMNNLGSAFVMAGEFRKAILLLEKCRGRAQTTLGVDDPRTLEIVHNLGAAYLGNTEFNKAIPLLEDSLKHRMTILGPDALPTLSTMSQLGGALALAGKYERALSLLKESCERQQTTLGSDHPNTLKSKNNLAVTYTLAGDMQKAIQLQQQTLAQSRGRLGDDHLDTLLSMVNLAISYKAIGTPNKALPLLEQALMKHRDKLGNDHPRTLSTMQQIAGVYKSLGAYQKAIQVQEETLDKRRAKLDGNHLDIFTSVNDLAVLYDAVGDSRKAAALLEQMLDRQQSIFGATHPSCLATMHNLATSYQSLGEWDKALSMIKQVIQYRRERLGVDHPDTLASLNTLAATYQSLGELDKAVTLYEEILQTAREKLGADHEITLAFLNGLAAAHWRLKDLEKSIPLFEETVRMLAKLGENHPRTLFAKANLGVNYRDAGRFEEAITLLEQSHRHAGLYPKLQWVSRALLAAYIRDERRDSAMSLIEELLAKSRAAMAPKTLQLASQLATLAHDLVKLNSWDLADSYLRECISIREELTPTDWLLFNTKSLLGEAMLGQAKELLESQSEMATARLRETEQLLLDGYNGIKQREDTIPEKYRNTRLTEALKRLVDFYTTFDKPDEAAKWQAELDKRAADNKPKEPNR